MRRPPDQDPPRVGGDGGKARLRRPEEQVELAVDDQARARVGGQPRPEPLADEGAQGRCAAIEREPGGDDRIRDPSRVAQPEETNP